jgi:uncharacterized protein (DUF1330 family)
MPAYVIGDVTVHDPEGYSGYTAHTVASLEPYGGRFVVRGGAAEVLEGDWEPSRLVVIEFPDTDAAHGWYASEAYQAILPIRHAHSTGRLVLVAGVDPAA